MFSFKLNVSISTILHFDFVKNKLKNSKSDEEFVDTNKKNKVGDCDS